MATVILDETNVPGSFTGSNDLIVERGADLLSQTEQYHYSLHLGVNGGASSLDVFGTLTSSDYLIVGGGNSDTAPGGDRVDVIVRTTGHLEALDGAALVFRDLDVRIRNMGLIECTDETPIVARSEVYEFVLVNEGTIRANSGSTAVVILHEDGVGGTSDVFNSGVVDGRMIFNSGHLILNNSGTISSPYSNTLSIGTAYNGGQSPLAEIVNSGAINGGFYSTAFHTDLRNSGTMDGAVFMDSDLGTANLRNGGLITEDIQFRDMTGFDILNAGEFRNLYVYGSAGTLRNSGLITSSVIEYAADNGVAAGLEVINTGTITGSVFFINAGVYRGIGGTATHVRGSEEDDRFYTDQSGQSISGGLGYDIVYLSGAGTSEAMDGIEEYRMAGTADVAVVGDEMDQMFRGNGGANLVSAGAGNDTVLGANGNDTMLGEDGDDDLFGGNGDDRMSGGAGNDSLSGGAGDDVLQGGHGDDTLAGSGGNDRMNGGFGADSMNGGDGDDVLDGSDGDDTVLGWTGADRLTGGAGRDILTGGADADVFVFDQLELGIAADHVTDFVQGEDLIDLGAFGSVSFLGLGSGTATFTATGGAEVFYTHDDYGRTWLRIDVDGNGTLDSTALFEAMLDLTAADFVL